MKSKDRNKVLVLKGMHLIKVWAAMELVPKTDEATLYLNSFIETLKEYPGWQRYYNEGMERLRVRPTS